MGRSRGGLRLVRDEEEKNRASGNREPRRVWLVQECVLKGTYRKDGERVFTRACSDRTKGNCFKLRESRFRLHIRKKLFTEREVRPWHREAVDAPFVKVFKARLDGTMSSLV